MAATPPGGGASYGPTIFLSAGEPSGDLHAAPLARALRARFPDARLLGLGGWRMAAEGTELLADVSELAVMGFAEVIHRLPYFLRLRRRVFSALQRERVDLVIPVDYPGFNLRLARRATQLSIPVLYYIAPQVWAWHASRARSLARDTRAVAVILPFEQEFLRRAGATAQFVGHPLLDVPAPTAALEEWAARWRLDPHRPVLALFPGSRAQEIRRHLPLFSDAAARIIAAVPDVQPVIAAAPDTDPVIYSDRRWPLVDSGCGLLHHATAALVKSGTTTLELALAGTPMVVAYRTSVLTYQIARRVVRVPHIALANLVAGRRLAPELVQDAATPETLAAAVLPLLNHRSEERRAMVDGLLQVREALGSGGAAERVAAMAAEILEGRA
ncbi:MAG: lipid-A-disaccharide synthase [Gemmatimonadetes bacterium]|nr:lipid-A-disaccharide synthase [Gemmatimonadota bacterium]